MKGVLIGQNCARRLSTGMVIGIAAWMAAATCLAASIAATTSGNWNDTSTWYPIQIPGGDDTVYIGSCYPSDYAAATATVTLVQDQSASNVYLGFGSDYAVSGTLDLGNYKLSIGNALYLGYGGPAPMATVTRGTGSFSAYSVQLRSGNTFSFGSLDTVSSLIMYDSSTTTTASAGNVTGNANIYWGSTLTLGADLNLTGSLDLQDAGSTLDMAGYTVNASQMYLGWNGAGSPTLLRRGRLAVDYLQVANQTFDINPTDSISHYYLSHAPSTLNAPVSSLSLYANSTATTTAAGNVSEGVSISGVSRLYLGADMTLTGNLNLQDTGSTLDMNAHALNASQVFLGWYGGMPTLLHRGWLTVTSNLYVANQTFDLNATDSINNFNLSNGTSTLNAPVSGLYLSNAATATTTSAGNVTGNANIYSGSTLTLGADMNLTGSLGLQDDSSTLDMAGCTINASQMYLGWNGGSPNLLRRGQLNVDYLFVANRTFDLNSTDRVSYFYLSSATSTLNSSVPSLTLYSNSTASTTAGGNVSQNVSISGGSRLNMGADMPLSGNLNLWDTGSTLDMNAHALNASQVFLGWYGGVPTLLHRGRLIVTSNLYVTNQTFDLNATDAIANFSLSNGASTLNSAVLGLYLSNGATATTTAAGNVTGNVTLDSASTLTLGADMSLSGNLELRYTGSTLDMAHHPLNASQIYLGWNGGDVDLLNRAQLTADYLFMSYVSYLDHRVFDLNAGDSIANFYLSNATSTLNAPVSSLTLYNHATATTTAAGNVSQSVSISSGSRFTMGADMTLSGNLSLWEAGSTLDMGGHALNASQVMLGWYGSAATTLLNSGRISANGLYVGNASSPTLHPGDFIGNNVNLSNASTLTVFQSDGELTGLTLNGTYQGNLTINDTSVLNLHLGQSPYTHWIFRWRDPSPTGNWSDVLTGLISAGQITFNVANGYYFGDKGGYTYIYGLPAPADFDWKGGDVAGPTDWSVVANWNPNAGTAYGQGVVLSFGAQPSANNVVDLGSTGRTVGGLVFVSATSTTIQSSLGHDLTLDNSGATSTIEVSGDHCISAPVIMNSDAQIMGLGTLTLSGGISGNHDLDIQCDVVAKSVEVDTLTLESGAMLTIQAIPGGPTGNTLTAVPEPSAFVLLAMGLLGLSACTLRRRDCRL
jgi:hypothetical protein